YTILILLCLLISVGVVFHDVFVIRKYFEGMFSPEALKEIMKIYSTWFPVFVLSAFVGSLGLILFEKTSSKITLFAVGILIGYLLRDSRFNLIMIGTFVPTLVHVYLFTGLFMLYGAMKSGSIPG